MRRVVSLCLPYLATDLQRRRGKLPAGPLVTARHDGRQLVIGATDAASVWLGLRPGLPIGQAQARVPGLVVVPATPDADAASLRRIARLCLRYAPLTAPDGSDGVAIDATGSAHLFGGERRMITALVGRFTAEGLEARHPQWERLLALLEEAQGMLLELIPENAGEGKQLRASVLEKLDMVRSKHRCCDSRRFCTSSDFSSQHACS